MGNCPSCETTECPKCETTECPKCETTKKIGIIYDENFSDKSKDIIILINELFQNMQFTLCKDEKMQQWKDTIIKEISDETANINKCDEMKEKINKSLEEPPFTTDKVTADLLKKLSDKIIELYCEDDTLNIKQLLDDISQTMCSGITGGNMTLIQDGFEQMQSNTERRESDNERINICEANAKFREAGVKTYEARTAFKEICINSTKSAEEATAWVEKVNSPEGNDFLRGLVSDEEANKMLYDPNNASVSEGYQIRGLGGGGETKSRNWFIILILILILSMFLISNRRKLKFF